MILDPEPISAAIVDAAVRVHRGLGAALLESLYQKVLAWELEQRGFSVQRERQVRFVYAGHTFRHRLRVDLLVNGVVVVEIKSVQTFAPVHFKQVQSYLRLLDLPLGLLLNFGGARMAGNMRRIVNNHTPSPMSLLRINQPGPPRNHEPSPSPPEDERG